MPGEVPDGGVSPVLAVVVEVVVRPLDDLRACAAALAVTVAFAMPSLGNGRRRAPC